MEKNSEYIDDVFPFLDIEALSLSEIISASDDDEGSAPAVKGMNFFDKTQYWVDRLYDYKGQTNELYFNSEVLKRRILDFGIDTGLHTRRVSQI